MAVEEPHEKSTEGQSGETADNEGYIRETGHWRRGCSGDLPPLHKLLVVEQEMRPARRKKQRGRVDDAKAEKGQSCDAGSVIEMKQAVADISGAGRKGQIDSVFGGARNDEAQQKRGKWCESHCDAREGREKKEAGKNHNAKQGHWRSGQASSIVALCRWDR